MLGLDGLHPSSRWDKWISSRERCVVVAPDIISHHVLVALVVGVARLQVGAAVLVVVRHEVRLEVQLEVRLELQVEVRLELQVEVRLELQVEVRLELQVRLGLLRNLVDDVGQAVRQRHVPPLLVGDVAVAFAPPLLVDDAVVFIFVVVGSSGLGGSSCRTFRVTPSSSRRRLRHC